MTQYDDTNRGALFPAANLEVFRQGKVNVEGTDRNVIIVQGVSKTGERYFQVYQQVGMVNANKQKKSDKSPDMIGDFETYDKGMYTIFGYKRQSKSGMDYTQVSIDRKEEQQNNGYSNQPTYQQVKNGEAEAPNSGSPFDDEIPF